MTPLVTAVIATYNYGRFVARAVKSVLEQTYPAVECIVVDDGSTDDTQQVLRPFASRVRIIHQENCGPSTARNRGIAESRGQYVAFLDADDWWWSAKTEKQVRWLIDHPSVGCVGCGREHVESDGRKTAFAGQRNLADREQTMRDVAIRAFWVGGSGSGAMVRREILAKAGGFDERLLAAEDWDLWLKLAAITELDNVPDVLTSISRHGTGVFRNVRRVEKYQQAIYAKAISAWPDVFGRLHRRKIQSLIAADAAGESVAARDRRAAARYVAASLRWWPFDSRRWKALGSIVFRSVRER